MTVRGHGDRVFAIVVVFTSCLLFESAARAATLRVPTDYPTIQAAIGAAATGDVVLVAPGTYAGRVDFLGKAIRLSSVGGPAETTLEHDEGPIVVFQSGEGLGSILEGFTIQSPPPSGVVLGGSGVGISCDHASPTIRGNRVTGNYGLGDGGGLSLVESSAWIEENEISANTSRCVTQFGLCGAGGGIHVVGGAPTLIANRIVDNWAPALGGGVYVGPGAQVNMIGNRITGNASGIGAGIVVDFQGTLTLDNNLLANNTAGGFTTMAGIFDGQGGGLYVSQSAVVSVESCTIAANNTLMPSGPGLGRGGGVWAESGANLNIANSIVWGNFAAVGIDFGFVTGANVSVRYSDMGGALVVGPGNQSIDPLFVSGFYLSQTSSGQAVDSPAIDAGDPASPVISGTTRTDGVPDLGPLDLGYHLVGGINHFVRGDCNADGSTNIADAVTLLVYLFPQSVPMNVRCLDACDASDDGQLNLGDAVTLLGAIFGGMPVPIAPPSSCGSDGTTPNLGCAQFVPCP